MPVNKWYLLKTHLLAIGGLEEVTRAVGVFFPFFWNVLMYDGKKKVLCAFDWWNDGNYKVFFFLMTRSKLADNTAKWPENVIYLRR